MCVCVCVCARPSQDAEALRGEVSRWEGQARQRERRLAEVERELLQSHAQRAELQTALEEGHAQLDESQRWRGDAEQRLGLRLQECEEELARQAAAPAPVKVRRRRGVGTHGVNDRMNPVAGVTHTQTQNTADTHSADTHTADTHTADTHTVDTHCRHTLQS